jgi:hypothetical protein
MGRRRRTAPGPPSPRGSPRRRRPDADPPTRAPTDPRGPP